MAAVHPKISEERPQTIVPSTKNVNCPLHVLSMDIIHGFYPWILSMDNIYGYHPWIVSMKNIHG